MSPDPELYDLPPSQDLAMTADQIIEIVDDETSPERVLPTEALRFLEELRHEIESRIEAIRDSMEA